MVLYSIVAEYNCFTAQYDGKIKKKAYRIFQLSIGVSTILQLFVYMCMCASTALNDRISKNVFSHFFYSILITFEGKQK
jgi:hypothetical protein